MRLIIQKAGVYNDVYLRAHKLQPGDVLETRMEYGQSLIASGFAINEKSIVPAEDVHEDQPSDNVRNENVEAEPEPGASDLEDGVDDGEATLASKTLATRKRAKKAV